jgi:uncharacterized phage-associated protein
MTKANVRIEDVSDFVLYYSLKNKIHINHLKLQKLLYYIQAWHLVYFDHDPLFEDVPEAWVNGPVYRKIYDIFKLNGRYEPFELNEEKIDQVGEKYKEIVEKLKFDKDHEEFFDSIFNHYGLMDHEKLVFLTHREKPWNEARKGIGQFEYSGNKISHESMFNYYSSLLKKA